MHHKTYRVSISLAKVNISFRGQKVAELDVVGDGTAGHDTGLDMALDYLEVTEGRKVINYGDVPKTDVINSSFVKTQHYLVVTAPAAS